jgi:hypothetical protein
MAVLFSLLLCPFETYDVGLSEYGTKLPSSSSSGSWFGVERGARSIGGGESQILSGMFLLELSASLLLI